MGAAPDILQTTRIGKWLGWLKSQHTETLIGDAVNEAARLADVAKTVDSRILCSDAAIERADAAEGQHWASRGSVLLRGRSDATAISAPRDRLTRSGDD